MWFVVVLFIMIINKNCITKKRHVHVLICQTLGSFKVVVCPKCLNRSMLIWYRPVPQNISEIYLLHQIYARAWWQSRFLLLASRISFQRNVPMYFINFSQRSQGSLLQKQLNKMWRKALALSVILVLIRIVFIEFEFKINKSRFKL